jgi:threo-3-hydroxy-L-aspartate ammonia-lyase
MSDPQSTIDLPAFEDVAGAADRLRGVANPTPVLTSRTLDERCASRVFLKAENFQRTGSFKFRGAYNAVSRIPEEVRRRGVLAYSSGNHAQAMALAGRLLGVPTVVVMPVDAPAAKREATREYGAEIVTYEPSRESREEVASAVSMRRGLTVVPPYDHPHVAAGQGTAALELLETAGPLDALYVPCGGGGLLSGSALAARNTAPECRVIGVEPELADDATRSFRTGTLHRTSNPPTIADGLRTPALGRVTFPVILAHVSEMLTVSEAEIVEAMRFLWTRMKLVTEPSGAVAVAAALRDAPSSPGRRIGVIVSGGNVDLSSACALLSEEEA